MEVWSRTPLLRDIRLCYWVIGSRGFEGTQYLHFRRYRDPRIIFYLVFMYRWAAVMSSVQRVATGWKFRGSNSGEAGFSGPIQPLYDGYRAIPGGKAAEEWR